MLVPSPERWWDRLAASHPNHLAAGEAAVRALMAIADPNHAVDITDVVERKITAILAHDSQHPQRDQVEPMIRDWLASNAVEFGLPEGRLAEVFRVHPTT